MKMETANYRDSEKQSSLRISTWVVDISNWNPSPTEWESTLALVSDENREKIEGYHHRSDAKRSLVGKIMVQKVVCLTYRIPWNVIRFASTLDGRPYLATQLPEGHRFDFNVSHDGDVVVCCFGIEFHEPGSLPFYAQLGVDVMQHRLPRSEPTVSGFLALLTEHLSPTEQKLIEERAAKDEKSLLEGLLQVWTLKEAVVKALGVGLRMELASIGLASLVSQPWLSDLSSLPACPELQLSIKGQKQSGWTLWTSIWDLPSRLGCPYILSAAVRVDNAHLLPKPILHNVEWKTISDILTFN